MASVTAFGSPTVAARRGAIYRLLTLAFAYPDPAADAAFWELVSAFVTDPNSSPGLVSHLRRLQRARADRHHRQRTHTELFDGDPAVSPYESHYWPSFGHTRQIADVAGFYRAFGFRLADHPRELPDFLATELEFMSLLCLKEALAGDEEDAERLEIIRAAQRAFLEAHLGRWAAVFSTRLRAAACGEAAAFYRVLADLLEEVVTAECRALAVLPQPLTPPTAKGSEAADPACGMCPVTRD